MRRIGPPLMKAVVLVAAAGLAAFDAGPAGAADEISSGWWWAGRPSQTVLVTLDPVPAVPDGGLYVSSDLSGPTGVSAVRVQLDDDVSDVVLTIAVDDSVGTPLVDACPAATPWQAAQGGTWDQRPQADCDFARVAGEPSDDGSTFVFYLDPLLRSRTLDIVLTPGKASGSDVSPTFAAAFKAIDAEALSIGRASGAGAAPDGSSAGTGSDSVTSPDLGPEFDPLAVVEPFSPPAIDQPPSPSSGATDEVAASVPLVGEVPEGFQYSAILLLPLLLLGAAGYVGWALTRPVMLAAPVRPGPSHAT